MKRRRRGGLKSAKEVVKMKRYEEEVLGRRWPVQCRITQIENNKYGSAKIAD